MGWEQKTAPTSFHFSKSEATVPGTTLAGLPNEDLKRSSGPAVDLVVDHVLQTLVVGRAQEDLSVHLPAGVTVVHHLEENEST